MKVKAGFIKITRRSRNMSEIDILKALVKYNTVEDKENQKILTYIELIEKICNQ